MELLTVTPFVKIYFQIGGGRKLSSEIEER